MKERRRIPSSGRVASLLVGLLVVLSACGTPNLPFISSPTPEQPRQLTIHVVEPLGQRPLAGARISGAQKPTVTAADGTAKITAMRGATLTIVADDHAQATPSVPNDGDLTVTLRPNVVAGRITDSAGKPLSGAKIFVDGQATVVRSDAQGRYRLGGVPAKGTLVFKLAGYRLGLLPISGQATQDVAMQPFQARALYAPASVFEGAGRLDQLLGTIGRTEANAMVIDVKEGGGWLYYATDLPAAKQAGAIMKSPLLHLDALLPKLKARGIYTIARMVVMKDDTLPKSRPQLAVHNSQTGKPWTDFGGNIWLDPFEPGVAEYIANIAKDLAAKGFDEVQLDYVRFYSDGNYNTADTNLPNTQSFRLPAIQRLFRVVSNALAPTKTFFGADVFPISFIAPDDQGIGQRPEVIMPYVDYFDPMVYPSHYGPYTFGYAVPNEHPYEIINRTLRLMNREAAQLNPALQIRPWIQDFGYGPFRAYTATDIHAEMKALRDNGADGWMIWNAAARFTVAALGPPRAGEKAGPMEIAAAVTAPLATATPSASP
jgi:hypothetical protein